MDWGRVLAGFGLVYPKKLITVLLLNSNTMWSSQTQLEKPQSSFHVKPVQCCACWVRSGCGQFLKNSEESGNSLIKFTSKIAGLIGIRSSCFICWQLSKIFITWAELCSMWGPAPSKPILVINTWKSWGECCKYYQNRRLAHLQVTVCFCVPPKAEQLHKSKGSFSTMNEQYNGLSPDNAMTELFPFFLKTSNSFRFA